MKAFLIKTDGSERDASREAARQLFTEGKLLWLDLYEPDDDALTQLGGFLGIHPLATEDAQHFGQRPKIDDYDHFTQVIAYGVDSMDEPLVEVHCFYSEHYLVTVRRGDCAAFAALRDRVSQHQREGTAPNRLMLLYRLLGELTDGFFGQNFAWMVTRLTSLGAFLALGFGTEIVAVTVLLFMFRRRGWL